MWSEEKNVTMGVNGCLILSGKKTLIARNRNQALFFTMLYVFLKSAVAVADLKLLVHSERREWHEGFQSVSEFVQSHWPIR
jgi:hypothetical protein